MPQRSFACCFLVLSLGCPWLVGACSAADEQKKYDSGVDEETEFRDLTTEQRATICETRAEYVATRIDTTGLARFWCSFTPAVLFSTERGECQRALDACVSLTSVQLDVQTNGALAGTCYVQTDLSQCRGTVEDYERCVDVSVGEQLRLSRATVCGAEGAASSASVEVTACAALGPECGAYEEPGPVEIR